MPQKIITSSDYKDLLSEIGRIILDSKKKIVSSINTTLTITYWNIGKYIVEFEQNGEKRAEYGKELLKNISKYLTKNFGKGYSVRNLKYMKQFYLAFNYLTEEKRQSLIAQLSWTHIVRLLSIKKEEERNFYIIEAIENSWSVRELDRQINSALYERLALSRNKEKVKELSIKGQIIENPEDVLKDPYILEFLGLDEKSDYSETEMETAIINNLEKFLLELGKGFTFVGRQQRFTAGTDHFYVDLVFYNRLLRNFVLIDLKIGKITHQDLGQMQMYVNYYDREIKTPEENPTIGILLCKEKHNLIVEYTFPKDNNQIFAKEYELYLPNKQELKKVLREYL